MANFGKIFRNFANIMYPLKNHSMKRGIFLKIKTSTSAIPTRSFKSSFQLLSIAKFTRDPTKIIKKDGTVVRKKSKPSLMVNLINGSQVTVLTLEAAEAIAKAKGLNLVEIKTNTEGRRLSYKLVKDIEMDIEHSDNQSKSAGEPKTVVFSSMIHDHDIKVKVKSMVKLLKKNKKLKCLVKKLGKPENAETVSKKIQEEIKNAGVSINILNHRASNSVLQFELECVMNQDAKS